MERTISLVLLFMLIFCNIHGQDSHKKIIYEAFISGKMKNWKKEIDTMEQKSKKSNDFILELVNFQIGYVGWCIGQEKKEEAKEYIKLATNHLNALKKSKYKISYVKSYEGAIDGLRIGLNIMLAPFIGPRILDKAKAAVLLNPQNPHGYILIANSKYYMWAMMGGSKEKALKYYHKAESMMESENLVQDNWNYLSLLTMIAHAYVETQDYIKADEYYQKILKVEPNYNWVKDELYPDFIKNIHNEE